MVSCIRKMVRMGSLIQSIKLLASATFGKEQCHSSTKFEENFKNLELQVNKLTSDDVRLDPSLLIEHTDVVKYAHAHNRMCEGAPVTYVGIYEDADFTISIFVLKRGARLPLHDHPLMHGILKVIYGTVKIQSYSIVDSQSGDDGDKLKQWPARLFTSTSLYVMKEAEKCVSANDNACILSPTKGNIHEIHSVNGPAAFVDILAPPYDTLIPGLGPRPCRYFEDATREDQTNLRRLRRIPSPSDYWCKPAPYLGPSLF